MLCEVGREPEANLMFAVKNRQEHTNCDGNRYKISIIDVFFP